MRGKRIIIQGKHRTHPSRFTRDTIAALALALTLAGGAALGAAQIAPKLLPEGTVLESVDGRLVAADANDTWLFELSADANSLRGLVTAGTRFEVLPCAVLERLITDVNERYAPTYRLSARVTAYGGKSFLLPTYYLPLSKLKGGVPAPQEVQNRLPGKIANAGEPDDELAIPQEIIEKLRERRVARGPQREGREPAGGAEAQKGFGRMLVDQVGLIESPNLPSSNPKSSWGGFVFSPDAFGWSIGRTRYELLPCSVLEQALQRQAASPDPLRFNVAGLVTEFKGKRYLLLQRAIRAYGYGNFGG
jgi:hypothetical protein